MYIWHSTLKTVDTPFWNTWLKYQTTFRNWYRIPVVPGISLYKKNEYCFVIFLIILTTIKKYLLFITKRSCKARIFCLLYVVYLLEIIFNEIVIPHWKDARRKANLSIYKYIFIMTSQMYIKKYYFQI